MKKILSVIAVFGVPMSGFCQYGNEINREVFNVVASIFVLGMVMAFILIITRRVMESNLKNKIIEKGVPEHIVSTILKSDPNENKNNAVRWFALLAGLGTAFIIIYNTLPIGVHSLAIISFCVSASFLGYYFFLKQSEK